MRGGGGEPSYTEVTCIQGGWLGGLRNATAAFEFYDSHCRHPTILLHPEPVYKVTHPLQVGL
jgi:hypothetical protein